ncbi:MAG: glycosyltransferase, partial [Acidimicrobiales bacterium]
MGMFVVGMHRSGTSAVTEVLGEMGFELPPPDRLVGANDSNPHGHFEVELLVDLNEEILRRLGGTWAAPPPHLDESLGPLLDAGLADEAARAFHESFRSPDFLSKDPRLCLLMPLWRAAVGDHPAILVVRSPLGIAASMRRRNGLPLEYGLALWERYMRLALHGLAGLPVLVQSYSEMLAGDHEALVSFAKQALADGADIGGPVMDTVDRGLVSHDVDEATAVDDPRLTPAQQALTRTLVDLRGVHPDFAPPELERETPNLDLAFRAMASAGDLGVREVQERIDEATRGWRIETERLRGIAADAEVRVDRARFDEIDALPPGRARRIAWSALGEPRYRELSDQPTIRSGLDRTRAVLGPIRRQLRNLAPTPRGAAVGGRARAVATAFRAGRFDRPLTVLIPIYNAVDDVERCLVSLDRFSGDRVRWVLVDDASTDARIAPLLGGYADRSHVTVLTNPENLGFTKSVNRGLAAAPPGDVVILNSDTVVTPGWDRRLRVAAFEESSRATATALSNAAGAFSFDAPMPTSLDEATDISVAVARASHRIRPDTPTGNGFCMFVTAEARAVVPAFDEEAFPRAYGEENDYCMRLRAKGFTHVVADDCVVFHADSASY